MQEVKGNMWDYNSRGNWICITTNGIVKSNGLAVMGAGNALEAARQYPRLPRELGKRIQFFGNNCHVFRAYNIITFPTKDDWKSNSDIELIQRSCLQPVKLLDRHKIQLIYLPRPGCKNGKLVWCDVKEEIEPLLDDRVVIISP